MTTKDLSIGYNNGKSKSILMEGLNLQIAKKQFIALLGANGVGKSTLIRTLATLQAALAGHVYLNEKEIKTYETKELARRLSLVLTDPIKSSNLTVKELVEMGRYPFTNWTGTLSENDHEKVEQAIFLCEIEHLKEANITEISDGQLQKTIIARALAQDGDLMLLDEPTVHLDANNRYTILELLRKLVNETEKSIVISTHQVETALKMADEIWLANFDGSISKGSPRELVKNGNIEKSFPYLAKMELKIENLS